jgi:hypothetical protein
MLAEELPDPDCPPVRVRLHAEDLVAFRATSGRGGGVGRLKKHRYSVNPTDLLSA